MDDGETKDVETESVVVEWKAETTPYERVRAVIATTTEPVSADDVASDARTSAKTARKHLNALANEGFVATTTGDHGATVYRRSAESLVVEQASDILDRVSTDELVDQITDMRDRLRKLRQEFGVDSVEELTVAQTNRTLTEGTPEGSDIDAQRLREWQTTRRNLAFANAALSIATAEQFVSSEGSNRSAQV